MVITDTGWKTLRENRPQVEILCPLQRMVYSVVTVDFGDDNDYALANNWTIQCIIVFDTSAFTQLTDIFYLHRQSSFFAHFLISSCHKHDKSFHQFRHHDHVWLSVASSHTIFQPILISSLFGFFSACLTRVIFARSTKLLYFVRSTVWCSRDNIALFLFTSDEWIF